MKINKYLIFVSSLAYYLIVGYLNEWVAINQPLYYNKSENDKDIHLKDEGYSFFIKFFTVKENSSINLMFFVLIFYFLIRFIISFDISITSSFLFILGSVMLLRVISFYITKIPPIVSKCSNTNHWKHKWLFLYDDKTCGDYMFSGHAATYVLISLFFTEFSGYIIEKILIWIISCIGILLLIITRIHYSVDVFIGFFVSILSFYSFKYICTKKNLNMCLPYKQ